MNQFRNLKLSFIDALKKARNSNNQQESSYWQKIAKEIADKAVAAKNKSIQSSNLSKQATDLLIVQVENNPEVEISNQLKEIDEVSKDAIEDVKKDENNSNQPKYLKPILVIGGLLVIYYLFIKKK